MASSFEVHQVFELRERGLFAVSGVIRAGMVETGMYATLGNGAPEFRERIHSIEYLDRPGVLGSPSLTFHYRDPAKLKRWMALIWAGQTLTLTF